MRNWRSGKMDMPPIEGDRLSFPFQQNYVDVRLMGSNRSRQVVTGVPNSDERRNSFAMPVFTCSALRATLEVDDPAQFTTLSKSLSNSQWEQLTLAVNLAGTSNFGGMWGFDVYRLARLVHSQNEDVKAWGAEVHYRLTNCTSAWSTSAFYEFDETGSSLKLLCRDLIRYLHDCSEVADVLTPLLQRCGGRRSLISPADWNELGLFYESIRPAADLWRTLPDPAIKPFIEVGNALALLEEIDKTMLLRLRLSVAAVGYKLDDNPAHESDDDDGKIAKWWKWTEGCFDYVVHYGVTPVETKKFLTLYARHIDDACDAFNPSIPTNIEVLKRLDRGWNSRGADAGPIIENVNQVFADLKALSTFLGRLTALCDEPDGEWEVPARPNHFCQAMRRAKAESRRHIQPDRDQSDGETC
jgi:hypothetical protein